MSLNEMKSLISEIQQLKAADRDLLRRKISEALDNDNDHPQPPVVTPTNWSPQEGAELGPYRLETLITTRGTAWVFRARRCDETKHQVAVKLLHGAAVTRMERRRLEAERAHLAALQNPFVVSLIDGGNTPQGLPWLAMEWVEGVPITVYADQQRLSISERLSLFSQACEAVAHCQQQMILHQDIKPSHLLVTARAELKLIDFGIAATLNETLGEEAERRRLTPAYAPPEAIKNTPLTTAADSYSLGLVLYELLCGFLPWDDSFEESGSSIARQLVERGNQALHRPSREIERVLTSVERHRLAALRATHPDQWPRRLRGDLDAILLRALSPDPSRRYRNAAEIQRDLWHTLHNLPVNARRRSWIYRWQKWKQRHQQLLGAAAVLAVFLSGSVAAVVSSRMNAGYEKDFAELRRARTEKTAAFLIDVFGINSLRHPLGNNTATRRLLMDARRQVEFRFQHDPLQQCRLLAALARIHQNLNDGDTARSYGLQALEIAETLQHPPARFQAEFLLAEIYDSQKDWTAQELHLPRLLTPKTVGESPRKPLDSARLYLFYGRYLYEGRGESEAAQDAARHALGELPRVNRNHRELATYIAAVDLSATIDEHEGRLEAAAQIRGEMNQHMWRYAPQNPLWIDELLASEQSLLLQLGRRSEANRVRQDRDMLRRSVINSNAETRPSYR